MSPRAYSMPRAIPGNMILSADYHADEPHIRNITALYQNKTYCLRDAGNFNQWIYLLNPAEWTNATGHSAYLIQPVTLKRQANRIYARIHVNYAVATPDPKGIGMRPTVFTLSFEENT